MEESFPDGELDRPGFELALILRPTDPGLLGQLEQKTVEYKEIIMDGELITNSVTHILSNEGHALGPHALYYPKTDAYLKWHVLSTVLDYGSVNSEDMYRYLHQDLAMRARFCYIQQYQPKLFTLMVEDALLVTEGYVRGHLEL